MRLNVEFNGKVANIHHVGKIEDKPLNTAHEEVEEVLTGEVPGAKRRGRKKKEETTVEDVSAEVE